MLFYCGYTWQHHATAELVRARFKQQHEAVANHPERFKGFYGLAGGGAGFIIAEVADHRDLTPMLQPYMDLVSWDVRAIYPIDYDAIIGQG